jgi:hypothetical protein
MKHSPGCHHRTDPVGAGGPGFEVKREQHPFGLGTAAVDTGDSHGRGHIDDGHLVHTVGCRHQGGIRNGDVVAGAQNDLARGGGEGGLDLAYQLQLTARDETDKPRLVPGRDALNAEIGGERKVGIEPFGSR